jgi:hypothetical protein
VVGFLGSPTEDAVPMMGRSLIHSQIPSEAAQVSKSFQCSEKEIAFARLSCSGKQLLLDSFGFSLFLVKDPLTTTAGD